MIAAAGGRCRVRPVGAGLAHRARRTMAMVDLVEALAARHAAAGLGDADAVIYSSVTAALLQPADRPYAIRFDTIAAQSRPGPTGLWQRRREPAVLAGARLLLPWSESAARAAHDAVGARTQPRTITLPVPIERVPGAERRDLPAVAYAANPSKRGLDLLCAAWRAGAPAAELVVGGIDAARARAYLAQSATPEPDSVRWAGDLPRDEWLALVARARIFVNASRYEDWGIGQLEALSAGTPLVTVPSGGPNEALPIARALAPALVTTTLDPGQLAAAIAAGLALSDADRGVYAHAADAALTPYRPETIRRLLAEEVLPALLTSSA